MDSEDLREISRVLPSDHGLGQGQALLALCRRLDVLTAMLAERLDAQTEAVERLVAALEGTKGTKSKEPEPERKWGHKAKQVTVSVPADWILVPRSEVKLAECVTHMDGHPRLANALLVALAGDGGSQIKED